MIGPAPKPTRDFIAGFEAATKIAQRLIEVPGLTRAQAVAVGGVALRLGVDLEALRACADSRDIPPTPAEERDTLRAEVERWKAKFADQAAILTPEAGRMREDAARKTTDEIAQQNVDLRELPR